MSSRVRLTKSPAQYLGVARRRRELPYEAMLASGRDGVERRRSRSRVSHGRRARRASCDPDETWTETTEPRDYDVEHYVRLLRETFAARLARAFTPADFDAVFADPDQLSLLPPSFETMRPILTRLGPI